MARHEETDVRNWVKALGGLCAGNLSLKEAEARMTAYAPMLAREFAPNAFTVASLAAVARACSHHSPTFGEISNALSAWWEDNAPTANVPLIAGPQQDPWRQRVERERAETKADWQEPEAVRRAIASLVGQPRRLELGRMLAAMIHRHAPQNVGLLPPEFLTLLEEELR